MNFNFFKKKENVMQKTIVPNAVYRSKMFPTHQFVVVCGISKPDLKTTDDVNGECYGVVAGIDIDHIPGNAVIYANLCDKVTYHHRRNAFTRNIVLFKPIHMMDTESYAYTIDDFLDQYELVVGYTEDGKPLTENDFKLPE